MIFLGAKTGPRFGIFIPFIHKKFSHEDVIVVVWNICHWYRPSTYCSSIPAKFWSNILLSRSIQNSRLIFSCFIRKLVWSVEMRKFSANDKCMKCRYYCKKFIAFLFSHIGLCGLVVAYVILGAITFSYLEVRYSWFSVDLKCKNTGSAVKTFSPEISGFSNIWIVMNAFNMSKIIERDSTYGTRWSCLTGSWRISPCLSGKFRVNNVFWIEMKFFVLSICSSFYRMFRLQGSSYSDFPFVFFLSIGRLWEDGQRKSPVTS